jgi:opacity protein-like surface antigen
MRSLLLLITCGALLASAPQANEPSDGLWHGEISLGGAIASGTNSTQSLNTRAQGVRRTGLDRFDLRLRANFGSSRVDGVFGRRF